MIPSSNNMRSQAKKCRPCLSFIHTNVCILFRRRVYPLRVSCLHSADVCCDHHQLPVYSRLSSCREYGTACGIAAYDHSHTTFLLVPSNNDESHVEAYKETVIQQHYALSFINFESFLLDSLSLFELLRN